MNGSLFPKYLFLLCGSGWPWTHNVAWDALKLSSILLQLSEFLVCRCVPLFSVCRLAFWNTCDTWHLSMEFSIQFHFLSCVSPFQCQPLKGNCFFYSLLQHARMEPRLTLYRHSKCLWLKKDAQGVGMDFKSFNLFFSYSLLIIISLISMPITVSGLLSIKERVWRCPSHTYLNHSRFGKFFYYV